MSPHIRIEPASPALDTPVQIRVTGLPAHQPVTVRAEMRDPYGQRYASHATFVTGEDGTVDLTRDASTGGPYTGVDAMGLIWSMQPVGAGGTPDPAVLPPQPVGLTVEVAGQPVAEKTFQRLRLPDGVRRAEVRGNGLVGTLFSPATDSARPAVIVLGGSEGGMHELDAALLAGHGFVALALAYFGGPGLPGGLVNIPLEYFGRAIEFLSGRRQVDPDRIGVIGGSRGAEAALLVATTFPQVGPVVSVVGSGLVTQGIPRHPAFVTILEDVQPSWTHFGQPLPFLPYKVTAELRKQVESGGPVSLGQVFRPDLADPDTIAAATIPVERARGPILFLTAGDDQGWPCLQLSRIALDRLDSGVYRHVHYPDAGHPIAPPPYGPATALLMPGPGVQFHAGGAPRANAHARADSWRQSLRFFTECWSAPGA